MEGKAISEIKKEVPNLIIVSICSLKVYSIQLTLRVANESNCIPRAIVSVDSRGWWEATEGGEERYLVLTASLCL